MINLKGNPVVLSKNYRAIMKQTFKDLVKLDTITAFTEAEEAAKKKKKVKRDAYGNVIVDTSGDIPISRGLSFELHFRLMNPVTGLYLNPENCNTETLDLSSLQPHQKSSSYHLQYVDH
jgi:hypothetical protein